MDIWFGGQNYEPEYHHDEGFDWEFECKSPSSPTSPKTPGNPNTQCENWIPLMSSKNTLFFKLLKNLIISKKLSHCGTLLAGQLLDLHQLSPRWHTIAVESFLGDSLLLVQNLNVALTKLHMKMK